MLKSFFAWFINLLLFYKNYALGTLGTRGTLGISGTGNVAEKTAVIMSETVLFLSIFLLF
jgi:hypothetical protein